MKKYKPSQHVLKKKKKKSISILSFSHCHHDESPLRPYIKG